ncbi:peptidoglycan DD-metalloendopeptidase family protein [soil metagenome]
MIKIGKVLFIVVLLILVQGISSADYDYRSDKEKQLQIYKDLSLQITKDIINKSDELNKVNDILIGYNSQIAVIADLLKKSDVDSLKGQKSMILLDNNISETNSKIKEMRMKFASKILWLYKNGKNYESEMLFTSRSLNDFYTRLIYLERISTLRKKEFDKIKKDQKILLETKKLQTLSYSQKLSFIREKQESQKTLVEKKFQTLNRIKDINYEIDEMKRSRDNINLAEADIEKELSRENYNIIVTIPPKAGYWGSDVGSLKGKLILPVESTMVISDFGLNINFKSKTFMYNQGMDVSIAKGSPVRSIATGIVSDIIFMPMYGNMVVIDHGNGYKSIYGITENIQAKLGAQVKTGDVIAYTSYNLNGQSFHFELWSANVPLDPKKWLNTR